MKIWALTKIGLKECIRQRVVYFIFAISLLFVFMAKGCDIGTIKGENMLIGKEARVEGATLTRSVIGDRAVLAPGTRLKDCTVWADTVVDTPLTLTGAILTPWGFYQVEGKTVRELAQV